MAKTGTREWSDFSFNCIKGCAHSCTYCYARVSRFNTKRGADWSNEEPYARKVKKCVGVVMFPTQHDITPGNLSHCLEYLRQLLDAGNRVLVVTKGGEDTVVPVVEMLLRWPVEQSEIRFTLSHWERSTGQLWEPNAPPVSCRINALVRVSNSRVRTSVSCEPWLDDVRSLVMMVNEVSPFVTETIWVGHANKLRERCKWCMTPAIEAEIAKIEARQTPEVARKVYEMLKDNPKVMWKDSDQKMLGLSSPTAG